MYSARDEAHSTSIRSRNLHLPQSTTVQADLIWANLLTPSSCPVVSSANLIPGRIVFYFVDRILYWVILPSVDHSCSLAKQIKISCSYTLRPTPLTTPLECVGTTQHPKSRLKAMMDESHPGRMYKRGLEKQVHESSEDAVDEEIEQKLIKLDYWRLYRFAKAQPYVFMGKDNLAAEEEWQMHVATLYCHKCVTASPDSGFSVCTDDRQKFACRKAHCDTCVELDYNLYPEGVLDRPDRRCISTYLYRTALKSLQVPVVINATCYFKVSNKSPLFPRAPLRPKKDLCY
jgi:hypothetical protein